MINKIKSSISKKALYNFVQIVIGSILVALSINLFFLANKIAPGGVSGIATVIHYVFHFPVGITVLALNIPLFLIGIWSLGKRFGIKTLFSTLILSYTIDATSFLKPLTTDPIMAAIFGGALMGLGLALVFRTDATTGGTDIAAKVLNKLIPAFPISEQLLIVDTIVVILAGVVFKEPNVALYSALTLYVSAKVIDVVFEGVDFAKAIFIISDQYEIISHRILTELERGVTGIYGKGMFSGIDKKILLCIVDRTQIPTLKKIVKEADDKAFIIVNDVREALGEGFKTYEGGK